MAPRSPDNVNPLRRTSESSEGENSDNEDQEQGRPLSDGDDEDSNNDSDLSSDDEVEIPPDPGHERRMEALRRENRVLTDLVTHQNVVLAQMEEMRSRISALTEARLEELQKLREKRAEKETDQLPGKVDGGNPEKEEDNDDEEKSNPTLK